MAGVYVALMLGSNLWARSVVHAGLERAGQPDARFMVSPVFANPLHRDVVVDTRDRYEKGTLWFTPAPHFRPLGYGVATNRSHRLAAQAAATPEARAFLRWARFPFFVIEATAAGPRVVLNDYRYSDATGRIGWSAVVVDPGSGQ